ncbi:hypothetical protein [Pedobacter borealis]|uniref:hypothetical protein n=1 Tax=Pedobacter borealis TaxID=475254 RepID=UPI00049378F6|nr:hypothetical protein [Pedobacter borealis]
MKSPILIVLATCLFLFSCKRSQPNGKYLVYSGQTSNYVSNPYYDEQSSRKIKDELMGKEFNIAFKDEIVIIDGFDNKKIVLNADQAYNKINPNIQLYSSGSVSKGYHNMVSLFTGTKENSTDLKIRMRRSHDNDFRDTSLVTDNDRKFVELSFDLKNLSN